MIGDFNQQNAGLLIPFTVSGLGGTNAEALQVRSAWPLDRPICRLGAMCAPLGVGLTRLSQQPLQAAQTIYNNEPGTTSGLAKALAAAGLHPVNLVIAPYQLAPAWCVSWRGVQPRTTLPRRSRTPPGTIYILTRRLAAHTGPPTRLSASLLTSR